MLQEHLEKALNDLKLLVDLTNQDLEDIREARHENIFKRIKSKENLISSFENTKRVIDSEITKLSKQNPDNSLEELLKEEEQNLLSSFRDSLVELKDRNRHYARMVLAVSEFYNSLLEKLIPSEANGYSTQKRTSSFLQVQA